MGTSGRLHAFTFGVVVLLGTLAVAAPAAGQPGRVVADLATGDGSGGVGVAFDGRYLYYTDQNGLTLHRLAADGGERSDVPILGAVGINALTYDVTHDWFWAVDSTGLNVYVLQKDGLARLQFVIEPVLQLPGLCKSLTGCSALVTGLAYDATNDSLWYVPGGSPRVYHFDTVGDLLGYFDVDATSTALSPECLGNRAMGIAAGAGDLYLTAGACSSVFRYAKSDANQAAKIGSFAQAGPAAADVECDHVSFAVDVAWVRDSADGHLRAVELPPATCFAGGGVKLDESKRWMTGGGELFFETPTGDQLPLHHGFHILCDVPVPDQPNNMSVTWKDAAGDAHRFHMNHVDQSDCLLTPDPAPPKATFNRIQGSGTGRLDGTQTGFVEFVFEDNGEPGTGDTGSITITDVTNPSDPQTVIVGCFGCPNKGNHQAHR